MPRQFGNLVDLPTEFTGDFSSPMNVPDWLADEVGLPPTDVAPAPYVLAKAPSPQKPPAPARGQAGMGKWAVWPGATSGGLRQTVGLA